MFDAMKIMSKMNELRQRMKEAEVHLDKIKAFGSAGGGLVTAVANGKKQILSIKIDESLQDREIIQNLVVIAVNQAQQDAELQAKEFIKKSTEGLMPDIPGLDLNNFLGR